MLHFLGDRVPHHDIASRPFEIVSGAAEVIALAAVRGATDPAVIGALAASLPDVEHVLRLPQPGGRKLFPSHRIRGWHREGGMSARTQLLIAGTLLGVVLSARRRRS